MNENDGVGIFCAANQLLLMRLILQSLNAFKFKAEIGVLTEIVLPTEIERAKALSDVGAELLLKGDPHRSTFCGCFFGLIVPAFYGVGS